MAACGCSASEVFAKFPLSIAPILFDQAVISRLTYHDGTNRHEYVIFSESARRNGIPQYLDTRDVYGYLTLENDAREAMALFGFDRSLEGSVP